MAVLRGSALGRCLLVAVALWPGNSAVGGQRPDPGAASRDPGDAPRSFVDVAVDPSIVARLSDGLRRKVLTTLKNARGHGHTVGREAQSGVKIVSNPQDTHRAYELKLIRADLRLLGGMVETDRGPVIVFHVEAYHREYFDTRDIQAAAQVPVHLVPKAKSVVVRRSSSRVSRWGTASPRGQSGPRRAK
jgi:hypothetical protein